MSLSSALNTAASGLAAVARGTDVVASNIANAATPGYGRREMQTASNLHTGGIRIEGIGRMINASVLSEQRLARADTTAAGTLAEYHRSIEGAVGIPGEAASLTDRLAAFEGALVRATARPDSDTRLSEVLATAQDLARSINGLGEAAHTAREQADRGIAHDVDMLNSSLADIARLNRAIATEAANGRDTTSLQDARQRSIDTLAEIVPLREVARDHGQISLFTAGGATLLDGSEPVTFSYDRSGPLLPGAEAAAGDLPYFSVDGRPLTVHQTALYGGGRLGAQFQIRDEVAPAMQAEADLLARDLAERFGAGGADSSLPAGTAGLFTDAGAALADPPEPGLAQRLAVNPAANPSEGGALWRLRDGFAVTGPGDEGDSRLLQAMLTALRAPRNLATPADTGAPRSAAGHAGALSAQVSTARVRSESLLATHTARDKALTQSLAEGGVDTDRELERLLALEQAYSANARVIKAADTMLDALLRI